MTASVVGSVFASPFAYVAALFLWLGIGSWIANRWHGIRPGPDVRSEAGPATYAFMSRQARANVRRWRRAIVAIGFVVISLVWGFVEGEEDDCQTRRQGRTDVRAAITAGVDEVARYARLEPPDRQLVTSRVQGRVEAELPLPDC